MKKVFAIFRKEILLRFSSPIEWLFFLILPIVFTVILAGGTGASGDNRVRLIVVDQAQSPFSQELISRLEQSPLVRPEVRTLEEAEGEFSQRRVAAFLILPAGLDMDRLQSEEIEIELRQQPNNLNSQVIQQAVIAVIGRMSSAVDIAKRSVAAAEAIRPFESNAMRRVYYEAALQEAKTQIDQAPERIVNRQASTQDAVDYDPRANSSAGQLITWVFIPLLGISSIFAFERQNGTLRRFLGTPTQRPIFLVGVILSNVLVAIVQMILLVVFGVAVMKLNWGQDPAALALMLGATALAGAAFGTLLGTFVKSEGQASSLSILLGMVMALLGGCWYPLELFPRFVRSAVMVLPTRWAMEGLLDIVLRGQGWISVLPEAGVLFGFTAVFFTLGILRFRYE